MPSSSLSTISVDVFFFPSDASVWVFNVKGCRVMGEWFQGTRFHSSFVQQSVLALHAEVEVPASQRGEKCQLCAGRASSPKHCS